MLGNRKAGSDVFCRLSNGMDGRFRLGKVASMHRGEGSSSGQSRDQRRCGGRETREVKIG